MNLIEQNISGIKNRMAAVADKLGAKPEDILLVAVSKTQTAEMVTSALRSGITHFGENKVQEASQKLPLITEPFEGFHFIGHLQSNKVKALLRLNPFLIHSVDSLHLAKAIDSALEGQQKKQEILLQVNTSGELSKTGVTPFELPELAQEIAKLPNLKVMGLMTIGRLSDQAEASRQDFRLLKELFDQLKLLKIANLDMKWLSMGMTNDFEIAIEEGANLVRIGSAIFGARYGS